ncbi:DUF1846 family protein [candidate division WOR-3 bacterium]|nr:DUF1846 family protein [candidate division WOR-3 bacterium]
MNKIGFDTDKYLKAQTEEILKRAEKFDKLYIEFGGKLYYDGHASRVLPGYEPDAKIKVLKGLRNKVAIIFCVSAKQIAEGQIHGDSGLTYDEATKMMLDQLKSIGLSVKAISINLFNGEKAALGLATYLKNIGYDVYLQPEIKGYPNNVDSIVSEKGYGKINYIKTEEPIVLITGPGPGSGKLATALALLYHDRKRKRESGYAKFETFPIWDLPLDNEINAAYEAATADIGDYNLIDPFHKRAYNKEAVSYNRDVDAFPIVDKIMEKIVGKDILGYKSPTDMCINMVKEGIIDEDVCKETAREETIRRYFRYKEEVFFGKTRKEALLRIERLMNKYNLKETDRKVVSSARKALKEALKQEDKGCKGLYVGAAIELQNGKIITGKNSDLLHATSAAIINATKELANVPDDTDLIHRIGIQKVNEVKRMSRQGIASLNVEEMLIALAFSSTFNPTADKVVEQLYKLKGCEMHLTLPSTPGDRTGLRNLGINVTVDIGPEIK